MAIMRYWEKVAIPAAVDYILLQWGPCARALRGAPMYDTVRERLSSSWQFRGMSEEFAQCVHAELVRRYA